MKEKSIKKEAINGKVQLEYLKGERVVKNHTNDKRMVNIFERLKNVTY